LPSPKSLTDLLLASATKHAELSPMFRTNAAWAVRLAEARLNSPYFAKTVPLCRCSKCCKTKRLQSRYSVSIPTFGNNCGSISLFWKGKHAEWPVFSAAEESGKADVSLEFRCFRGMLFAFPPR